VANHAGVEYAASAPGISSDLRAFCFDVGADRAPWWQETIMHRRSTLLLIGLCWSLRSDALANNDTWKSAASGVWEVGSNWLDNSTPNNGDQASFNQPGTYGVTFGSAPAAIQDLFVIAGDVTFASGGTTRTLNVTSGGGGLDALISDGAIFTLGLAGQSLNLAVGDDLRVQLGGTLNVDRGSQVNAADFFVTTSGTTNVSLGSSIITADAAMVGDAFGSATLNITNAGHLSDVTGKIGNLSGTSGTVAIDGIGSTWINSSDLFVGLGGTGDVGVTGGGLLTDFNGYLGYDTNSSGTANVSDTGSNWVNTGQLFVGLSGTGTLHISDGGSASGSTSATLGYDADSMGSAVVEGEGSTWSNQFDMYVGNSGTGELTIQAAGTVTNGDSCIIGSNVDSVGTATVTGAGSTWTNAGPLDVGFEGTGTLMIADGGSVSSTDAVDEEGGTIGRLPNASGMATVTGVGSSWTIGDSILVVGQGGTGTLAIADGGSVSNGGGTIGDAPNSSGMATVTGASSTWTNGRSLVVGRDGMGELTVEEGGHVSSSSSFIGDFDDSTGVATVTGGDSSWTAGLLLAVGQFGHGTLTIAAGGFVSDTNGSIAGQPDSVGMVTVTGGDSTWENTSQLFVAFDGSGTLAIEDGGHVNSANTYIAGAPNSMGVATVSGSGSTWTITGRFGIGEGVDEELGTTGGDATLAVGPGGTVSAAQDMVLYPGAHVRLQGGTIDAQTISFEGGGEFDWTSGTLHVENFNGNLLNQGGTLAPGYSAGSTTITGSYEQQADATLAIEIGGTTPGSGYDQVNVSGSVILGGELQLAMLDGFLPDAGDAFTILESTGGQISDVFTNVASGQRLPTVDGLGSFLVHYGPGSAFDSDQIILSAFTITGDYSGNGIVDAADYTVWRNTLGSVGNDLAADGNGDGSIDAGDYQIWKVHFGQTAIGGLGAITNAAVPEPATLLLTILAAACCCALRSRAV
jgi:T5SS/PEP-CTERM-associated repeat protein